MGSTIHYGQRVVLSTTALTPTQLIQKKLTSSRLVYHVMVELHSEEIGFFEAEYNMFSNSLFVFWNNTNSNHSHKLLESLKHILESLVSQIAILESLKQANTNNFSNRYISRIARIAKNKQTLIYSRIATFLESLESLKTSKLLPKTSKLLKSLKSARIAKILESLQTSKLKNWRER